MAAPTGKAIYARNPAWYPEGNPAKYAAQLGCDFIALHHSASRDEHLRQAADVGLPVYLWSHPDSWTPSSWPQTLDAMSERVDQNRLRGFIADPEYGWQGHSRRPLADRLASAAQSLPSVGITSYPSWYIRDFSQAAAAGLWGSPQLYGIIDPGYLEELRGRADPWRKIFGNDLVPSLAAWVRTPLGNGITPDGDAAQPPDQRSYLRGFTQERGALLWQTATSSDLGGRIRPWPGSEGFEILRQWQPEGALPQALVATFMRKVVSPFPWRRRIA